MKKIFLSVICILCVFLMPMAAFAEPKAMEISEWGDAGDPAGGSGTAQNAAFLPDRYETLVLEDSLMTLWGLGIEKLSPSESALDMAYRTAGFVFYAMIGDVSEERAEKPESFEGVPEKYTLRVPSAEMNKAAYYLYGIEVLPAAPQPGLARSNGYWYYDLEALKERGSGTLFEARDDLFEPGYVEIGAIENSGRDNEIVVHGRMRRFIDIEGEVSPLMNSEADFTVTLIRGKNGIHMTSLVIEPQAMG